MTPAGTTSSTTGSSARWSTRGREKEIEVTAKEGSKSRTKFFHIASISLRHYLHDETLLSSINININIYIESMLCKMFALCVLLEFRDVSLFINSCPLDWNFILRIVEKISHSFCFISIIFEIFIKYIFTLKRLFVEFSLLIIIYIIFTWIWYK